jgi:cytochrome c oxidase assembly factor CtaG
VSPPFHPYGFDGHVVAWSVVGGGLLAIVAGHRRLARQSSPPTRWPRREIVACCASAAAALVALTWPVADLAAHWSLTALVVQRLVLVLVVAPLLLLGLPDDVLRWATRPASVDACVARCQRPVVAVVIVTAVLGAAMTPALVSAQSSSVVARGVIDVAVVVAGLVLWTPVVGRIPGVTRPRPIVRFVYLVVQAVVPAFLSFVFILSVRPLYAVYHDSQAAIGLRALNDQQLAGFVSKLGMLLVLLTVGAVVLARASRDEEDAVVEEPLVWGDVEREFERADRRAGRSTGSGT